MQLTFKIFVKIADSNQVRRITIEQPNFGEFRSILTDTLGLSAAAFDQKSLEISYQDEEGDTITVSSEPEWQEALRVLNSQKIKKIFLTSKCCNTTSNTINNNNAVPEAMPSRCRRRFFHQKWREQREQREQTAAATASASTSTRCPFAMFSSQVPACNGLLAPIHRLMKCPELIDFIPSLINVLTTTSSPSSPGEIGIDIDLRQLRCRINSLGIMLLEKKKYLEAKDLYQLALQLHPEDCLLYYNLACAESLLGNVDEAVQQLRNAVLHGYSNVNHLERDVDFANIAHLPAFKEIVQQLRAAKSPYMADPVPSTVPTPLATTLPVPEQEVKQPEKPAVEQPIVSVPIEQKETAVNTPAEDEYAVELKQLEAMGFLNRDANVEYLIIFNGDLDQVISALLMAHNK